MGREVHTWRFEQSERSGSRGQYLGGLSAVLSIGRPQLPKIEVEWIKQGPDCARSTQHHRDPGSRESTAPC
jgi:hypothetical protein